MAVTLKKSYRFALRSALHIFLLAVTALLIFQWIQGSFDWLLTLTIPLLVFVFAFLIIQSRIERFIYGSVKKIYDDVALLESSSLATKPITTDMKTLTEEIEKFAQNKKVEINTLKIREEYRKDFLGNVSHELKTPLFTVQGYILTLLDGAIKDKKVREKYLERASKGVERLIYIVKDLDLITSFEAGNLRIVKEEFNVIELIQNVFDLLEMKAAKKGISLTFDLAYNNPIYVIGDAEKIQQVLTNLIVNSIKYGHEKGTVEVSVENLVQNKVIVRVTDNGGGIPKEHLPRIFERFYRVDQSGSRKEGVLDWVFL